MKRFLLGLLAVWLTGFGTLAFADQEITHANCGICNSTVSENHLVKTGGQFTRGAANLAFCWLGAVNQPIREMRGGGNLLVGFGKGFGHIFIRGAQGLGEIVTAPLPQAKDGSQIAQDCPLCMWTT